MICAGLWYKLLVAPSGMEVQLPRAITSSTVVGPSVQIVITDYGSLHLNGEVITENELKEFLKQITGRRQTVVINADRRVPWGYVVRIWETIRSSGIADCVMAVHP